MRNNSVSGSNAHAKGVALIFALLLLVVLTVLAVGTFSSVGMQERMASNANLQALAFEAASAGVTETLERWLDEANWPEGATCNRGVDREDWVTDWTEPAELTVPGPSLGIVVQYRTRLGCFQAEDWELLTGSSEEPPQQLLALSQGHVFRTENGVASGNPIAEREIEVRLERRGGDLPDCLMQFCPLDLDNLRMGTSQPFSIEAEEGGCPIGAASAEDAQAMRDQLRPRQVGQYRPTEPGITSNPLRGAWGKSEELARAVNGIKIGLRAHQEWTDLGLDFDATEFLGHDSGTNPFHRCAGTLVDRSVKQSENFCPSGGITYVAGDLAVAGDCVMEGMVIVEGSLQSSGTPAYTGNVLLLGGSIRVNGWGQAPNSGLLIAQHLKSVSDAEVPTVAYKSEDVEQGLCTYDVAGGGTATIRPLECVDLQKDWNDLNACLEDLATMTDPNVVDVHGSGENLFEHLKDTLDAEGLTDLDKPDLRDGTEWTIEFPVPECAGEPSGGRRNVIASWREFIDAGRWPLPLE